MQRLGYREFASGRKRAMLRLTLLSCALSASALAAIAQDQPPEQAPALQPAVP